MQEREHRIEPEDARPAAWEQWERAVPRPRRRRNREWLILGVVCAIIAALLVDRISHHSSAAAAAPSTQAATAATPAQMLTDLDGDKLPLVQYQAALGVLDAECTQDETHIAALANAGYQDLVKNGITDETRLSVLRHLADSIPPGGAPVDCAGVLSAYLVLREG